MDFARPIAMPLTLLLAGEQSTVTSMFVCLFVHEHISETKLCQIFGACCLLVWFSSAVVAMCYMLPVLWMSSYFT